MTKCNSFSFYNDCLSPQIHSETVSIDVILHVDTLLYWYRAVRPYDNSITWVKFLRHFPIALVEICIRFPTIKKNWKKTRNARFVCLHRFTNYKRNWYTHNPCGKHEEFTLKVCQKSWELIREIEITHRHFTVKGSFQFSQKRSREAKF